MPSTPSKWNVWVAVRSNGKFAEADWNKVKNWSGPWGKVMRAWSTTGIWDWFVELATSNPEDAQAFVQKLRKEVWVEDTNTQWWQEV